MFEQTVAQCQAQLDARSAWTHLYSLKHLPYCKAHESMLVSLLVGMVKSSALHELKGAIWI